MSSDSRKSLDHRDQLFILDTIIETMILKVLNLVSISRLNIWGSQLQSQFKTQVWKVFILVSISGLKFQVLIPVFEDFGLESLSTDLSEEDSDKESD